MPKGRIHVPPVARDGVWFQHRGLPETGTPQRTMDTTTGRMFLAPYLEEHKYVPMPPPKGYTDKDMITVHINSISSSRRNSDNDSNSDFGSERNFKPDNPFSMHNNRHAFQDHGVYFGDGKDTRLLGRSLTVDPHERHHSTSKHFLRHHGLQEVDYNYLTSYRRGFKGDPTLEPPRRRRFPRTYPDGVPNSSPVGTTTTNWNNNEEFRTPLQVLASSQEPFAKKTEQWKYSNHGLPRIYPPYDRKGSLIRQSYEDQKGTSCCDRPSTSRCDRHRISS